MAIFENPALSGSLPQLERPGLHDLFEALKAGDVDQVVVTRLDRLARDTMPHELWTQRLLAEHIQSHCIQMDFQNYQKYQEAQYQKFLEQATLSLTRSHISCAHRSRI